MHIHAHKLLGFSLGAADGEIGKVKDVYFDDNSWIVRYLVVETGNWLFKRRVLISPYAVEGNNIKNSPNINTDMPVSRQQESSLTNHYSWPSFGRAGLGWPTTGMIKGASALVNKVEGKPDFDLNLRSFSHVAQYEVYNESGRIGPVKDLAVDLADWSIPFLLLDDASTSDQERVIISTSSIVSINWETFQVKVSLNQQDVQQAFRINSKGFFAEDSEIQPPLT
jgi:sporulation protein YlmC with PRC-barrel domain